MLRNSNFWKSPPNSNNFHTFKTAALLVIKNRPLILTNLAPFWISFSVQKSLWRFLKILRLQLHPLNQSLTRPCCRSCMVTIRSEVATSLSEPIRRVWMAHVWIYPLENKCWAGGRNLAWGPGHDGKRLYEGLTMQSLFMHISVSFHTTSVVPMI